MKQLTKLHGFTALEMIIVLAVIAVLLSSLVLYSKRGENLIVLFREQSHVVSTITRAKSLSVATYGEVVAPGDLEVPCGYGAHFEPDGTYWIFKDKPLGSDCPGDKKYTDSSEVVGQTFRLPAKIVFENLQPKDQDIVFLPPNPTIIIGGDSANIEMSINLKTTDSESIANVKVTRAGQITAN